MSASFKRIRVATRRHATLSPRLRRLSDAIGESKPFRVVAHPVVHGSAIGLILVLITLDHGFSPYNLFLLTVTLLFVVAALGLNIPAGFLGQLSLGQGGAFGLGAYVAGALTVHLGWPIIFTILGAFAAGGILGALIAIPAGRLGLIGLAMMSLGVTLVISDAATALTSITGGQSGLLGVTAPILPGGGDLGTQGLCILVICFAVGVYLLHWTYRIANIGRASLAIRGNRVGAAGLGISAYRVTIIGFAVGTAIGASAGALYAYAEEIVAPDAFTVALSVQFLLMVVLGGAGTRVGPVIGGAVIGLLPIVLSHYPNVTQYVYGALLILIVRVLPRGIVSKRGARVPADRFGGWRHSSGRDAAYEDPPTVAAVTPDHQRAGDVDACVVLDGVGRHFGGVYAAQHVSLTLRGGEVVAIVGANGSGKTTVLNLISGFYAPQEGTVTVAGRRVNGMAPYRIARLGVARTFQVPQLFPDLTVAEHLALARNYATSRRPDVDGTAEALLRERGFSGRNRQREARLFSHGEQRFLEICMSLLRGPDVLLLDEPAAGLSQGEIESLDDAISRVARLGIGIVFVEHHHDFVRNVADRILVMHLGRTVWSGVPEDFGKSEAVRRAYLIDEPSLSIEAP